MSKKTTRKSIKATKLHTLTQQPAITTTMVFLNHHWPLVVAPILGMAASFFDVLPSWLAPYNPDYLRTFQIITNSAAVWLSLTYLAARHQPTPSASYRRGLLCLILLLIGYYTFGIFIGDRGDMPLSTLITTFLYWLTFAAAAAFVYGNLAFKSQTASWPPMVIGLTLISEALYRLWPARLYFSQDLVYFAGWLFILAAGLIVLGFSFRQWRLSRN